LDVTDPENNGVQNERFIVWMKISSKSNFRKLHAILNTKALSKKLNLKSEGLPRGKYVVEIFDSIFFQSLNLPVSP